MASGSSVSIVQNGVVKRIIVPSAVGKSATPVGEVTQIFGAELTPTVVASTSQAGQQPGSQFIGSHISTSANVGVRSVSPSLLQARNQLTNALASNKVYLTTAQSVGSLNTLSNTTQLSASAISGVQVAIPASTINSVSGQYPVVVMQEQQPVLIQSQQSPRMLNQWINSGRVFKNGLVLHQTSPTTTATQLTSPSGQRIVYQVPAQALQTQVSPKISQEQSAAGENYLDTTSVDEKTQSVGDIQIGSVFSLKDRVESPYNDLSKVTIRELLIVCEYMYGCMTEYL